MVVPVPPQPAKYDPAELPALAQAAMRAAKFPVLATVDGGQPCARPVSPVRTDGFVVYVANLRRYGKTEQIARNPRVELCYLSPGHDQVRITAEAQVVTEQALLEEIWAGNPLLRQFLGTAGNPELVVYRCIPKRIRFMKEWALEYSEVPVE